MVYIYPALLGQHIRSYPCKKKESCLVEMPTLTTVKLWY